MRDVTRTPSALIDAAELARMLSVSKPSIWRWKEAGKLPSAITLTAQCVRWKRDVVLSWINAGCPSLNEQRPAAVNGEASANCQTPIASEVTR